MKPEYERTALIRRVSGVLAALKATKEPSVAEQHKVTGYPTVKYFAHGVFKFDVNVREADKNRRLYARSKGAATTAAAREGVGGVGQRSIAPVLLWMTERFKLIEKVQMLQRRNLQGIEKQNLQQKLCDNLQKIIDEMPKSEVKIKLVETQMKSLCAEVAIDRIEIKSRDYEIEQ